MKCQEHESAIGCPIGSQTMTQGTGRTGLTVLIVREYGLLIRLFTHQ